MIIHKVPAVRYALSADKMGVHAITVIGGGLIGCEFANDLTSGGFKVSVVDIAPQPLPRLLPPEGAALLKRKLAALGVDWHLGTSVAAIDSDGASFDVTRTAAPATTGNGTGRGRRGGGPRP